MVFITELTLFIYYILFSVYRRQINHLVFTCSSFLSGKIENQAQNQDSYLYHLINVSLTCVQVNS